MWGTLAWMWFKEMLRGRGSKSLEGRGFGEWEAVPEMQRDLGNRAEQVVRSRALGCRRWQEEDFIFHQREDEGLP